MALLHNDRSRANQSDVYAKPCRCLRDSDAVIRALIDRIGPCRLRPRRNHFATLCDSIISQQLSTRAAATIYDRFAGLYPGCRPTPLAVTSTRMPTLRAVGLSPQKAGYVRNLAAGFSNGRIQTKQFGWQTNEEIINALSSIKGIGRWTAEMFLIFSLNRLDVLPVDDLGVRKAVKRWYVLRDLPSPTKLRTLAKPWYPYESVACWYLWQSLRLEG